MQEIQLTTTEAIFYLALIGAAAGMIVGLVPLIYGWKKGKARLGILAMISSVVAGGVVSIFLSMLVMVVFVFLIARKNPVDSTSKESTADGPDEDSDSVI